MEKKEAGKGRGFNGQRVGKGRGTESTVERVGKRRVMERGEGWMAERVGKGRGSERGAG